MTARTERMEAQDVKAGRTVELVEGYPLYVIGIRRGGVTTEFGRVEFRVREATGEETSFKCAPTYRLRVVRDVQ